MDIHAKLTKWPANHGVRLLTFEPIADRKTEFVVHKYRPSNQESGDLRIKAPGMYCRTKSENMYTLGTGEL
jgi:hypothetical protein